MQREDRVPLPARQQAFERLLFPLQPVDRLRLLAVLVHRQHQAAIEQLLVDVDGRGGEEHHHRTFHAILMRDEPARLRVLARRCDRQHAFALQQLQRVGGAAGALPLPRWPAPCALRSISPM